jgi:hypothetical protein
MNEDVPDYVTEQGPEYVKWWTAREAYIAAHYSETPTIDKYLITIETEVEFTRENDGVFNEHDVELWLRTGEIDLDPGHQVIKIEKVT